MKVSVLPIVEFRCVHRSDFFALSGQLAMAVVRHSDAPAILIAAAGSVAQAPTPALINHQNLAPVRLTISYH
jgi:hypothetical protein